MIFKHYEIYHVFEQLLNLYTQIAETKTPRFNNRLHILVHI